MKDILPVRIRGVIKIVSLVLVFLPCVLSAQGVVLRGMLSIPSEMLCRTPFSRSPIAIKLSHERSQPRGDYHRMAKQLSVCGRRYCSLEIKSVTIS